MQLQSPQKLQFHKQLHLALDLIAQQKDSYYSGLFWFTDIEQAKAAHIDLIQPKSRVLIVGGGSGSMLSYLAKDCPNCQVDYVEVSGAMMQRAKKRDVKNLQVKFFHSTNHMSF